MSDAKPNGKLMAGAIGGFMLGGGLVIMALTGSVGMGGGAQAAGGLGLIAFLLLLAGGICASLGWFGMGSIYGGTNSQAGVFNILLAASIVLMVLAGIMMSFSLIQISLYVFMGSLGLGGLLGGLGLMGGAGKAEGGGGPLQIGGILLLVGGAAVLLLFLMMLAQFGGPGLAKILSWVGFLGLAAGHVVAGVAMMGQRA